MVAHRRPSFLVEKDQATVIPFADPSADRDVTWLRAMISAPSTVYPGRGNRPPIDRSATWRARRPDTDG